MKAPFPLTFHASDGTPLAGVLHEPDEPLRPAVLIAGALGVAQRYYAPFAAWLAGRGHPVMTFDLRGMGASRQPRHRRSLRGLEADMLTWSQADFPAAVRHLVTFNAGRPIAVIGHSLGLHHAGMTDPVTQRCIAHAIGVGSGAGHWRDWAAPSRRLAPWMFHLAGPLLTPLFGYFPGKRFRMVGDLPAPAMRQWARWCTHPDFAWGAEPTLIRPRLADARFPVTAFSFTDDEAMTERCTRQLLAAFVNAPTRLIRLAPDDVGRQQIGHLGAFRPDGSDRLWMRFSEAVDGGYDPGNGRPGR